MLFMAADGLIHKHIKFVIVLPLQSSAL